MKTYRVVRLGVSRYGVMIGNRRVALVRDFVTADEAQSFCDEMNRNLATAESDDDCGMN